MSQGRIVLITRCTLFVFMFYLLLSCQKETSSDHGVQTPENLQIYFKPIVGPDALVFGKTYTNAFAEDYSINTFKFYLHGIEFINLQKNISFRIDKNNHYLINVKDSGSSLIKLNVPLASYDRISFIIGVDSILNVSGAQTGALDPAHGMFWTWSTGYIMAKLEGNSPVATTPNNVIEYHIGGFKGSEGVLRKVNLDFPVTQNLILKHGTTSNITIAADIDSWFRHPNPIRISQKPVAMTPGTLAAQIADNYANMFTVAEIVNE
jgi:hypothetical protein